MPKNRKLPSEISADFMPFEQTLYVLRHGEIATPGILAGKTDVALSEFGQRQLWQATESIKNISLCISSPMLRCCDWANQYCQQNSLELTIEPKIKEMDFGDWDGQKYQVLWQLAEQETDDNDEGLDRTNQQKIPTIGEFWQDPWKNGAPNGEGMQHFVDRIDRWWQEILNNSSSENLLVVTHGGVIKHLLARVLNLPIPGTTHMAAIDVPYASLIKISLYHDEYGKTWSKIVL